MKKKIGVLLAVAILAGGAWFGWTWYQKKNEAPPFREVRVNRGDLDISVLATGAVKPENRLELKPPIAGRVESIMVEEGQRVQQGQVLAWMSSSERAALLDEARAKGPQELAHWEELFKPTPLLAPLNGLIIVKAVVPGQVVGATDSVLVMSDHLIINTQVDETDIGQIKLGQKTTNTLDAYPKQEFPGAVTRIGFESKTVNNVTIYEVEVLPDTVPEFMRSGMTANVRFMVDHRSGILLLPTEAIHQGRRGTSVLVPNPSDPAQPTPKEVTIGLSDGKNTEIVSGLMDGETVLVPTQKKIGGGGGGTSTPFSPLGGPQRRGGNR